jgi:hypothetical protein
MSQTSCLVRPSPEVSTHWSCSPSPTTKCIVLRWQLMQSRNPAAARISRRLAPPATTILPHHLLCDSFRKVSARKRPTLCRMASLQAAGSGAPHAGPVRASPVSRLLPYRLRWSKLQPPREWRNGRRAGLRIRCPKGRGSSTLPSRTLLTCGSSFRRHSPTAPTCPSCSRLFTEGHEPNQPSRRTGSVDLCRQLRDVGGSRARRGHDHGKTPASRCTT